MDYIAVETRQGEVLVTTERAARNMAYQGLLAEEGKVTPLVHFKGNVLVGAKVKAPLAQYEFVHLFI